MVAFLKKPEGSAGFYQIVYFLNSTHVKYALTENPTIYVLLIHQFWQTAIASTSENGEMEITTIINGRVKTVTKASIRRHLKETFLLNGGEGSTVPVESQHTPTDAPSTSPPHISPTIRIPIRQETKVPQLSSPPHTNVADKAASTGVDVRHGGAATTVTSLDAGPGSGNINKTLSMPYDSPLPRGITLVQINAENQVTHTKVRAQGEAHTQQDQPKDHLRVLSAAKVLADAARKRREVVNVQSYTRRRRAVSTGSGEISTAEESVSTA
ncbi:hypothetical protein Tco_1126419, partial [Tanacetum coccineum]